MRYQLLPHLYTAFHQANKQGTPAARPLWFDYPQDPTTHSIDDQWFLGDVLITPILDQVSDSLYDELIACITLTLDQDMPVIFFVCLPCGYPL